MYVSSLHNKGKGKSKSDSHEKRSKTKSDKRSKPKKKWLRKKSPKKKKIVSKWEEPGHKISIEPLSPQDNNRQSPSLLKSFMLESPHEEKHHDKNNNKRKSSSLSLMKSFMFQKKSQKIFSMDDQVRELQTRYNHGINKRLLFKVLKKTQCPLTPQVVLTSSHEEPLYYFNGEFWHEDHPDTDRCKMAQFKSADHKRQLRIQSELMLCIDSYLSSVRINTSYEIHQNLEAALHEHNADDANKLFVPTCLDRLMFLAIFLITSLNAQYLWFSIIAVKNREYETEFMNYGAFIVAISETVLYGNCFIGKVVSSLFENIRAKCTGNKSYFQAKTVALALKELSALSILRYLPSVEIMTNVITHFDQFRAKLHLEFDSLFCSGIAHKQYNIFQRIFSVPMFIVELFAPLLSILAMVVKMQQLRFTQDTNPFPYWSTDHWFIVIGFLNQVAGLRVIRNIQAESIQHFVFSGSNASMDKDEMLLLNKWWNVTILSAVSSLELGWYDNMVFWYSLDPQKIQLLLKNHFKSKTKDDFLDLYDKKVMKIMMDDIFEPSLSH